MFKNILLPTDGSKLADKAVRKGIDFAKAVNAAVTLVHVSLPYRRIRDEGWIVPAVRVLAARYNEQARAHARELLAKPQQYAAQTGVQCKTVYEVSELPYEAIIRAAQRSKCDLIMMASHGRRGLQGLLLGSETTKVLTHSKIPVLVYR